MISGYTHEVGHAYVRADEFYTCYLCRYLHMLKFELIKAVTFLLITGYHAQMLA